MKATIYTQKDCPACVRVKRYLEQHCADGLTVLPVEKIQTRGYAGEFADLVWQDKRMPLVYIDGLYQELDVILKKVATWEIAQNQDGDRCSQNFILGEEVMTYG